MKDFVKTANTEYRTAIKKFGTYSFWDKGPSEVMNLSPFVSALREMTAEDAAQKLKELSDMGDGQARVVNEMLVDLQDMDEWLDQVLDISGLEL